MSEGNRVAIASKVEASYGVDPGGTGWQAQRFTSQSISANPQTVMSNEIRSDRQVSDLPKVGEQVGGDIGVEFSCLSFDEWLEAAMCGTWAGTGTEVLKAGITERSFAIEVQYTDIAQYNLLLGMRCGGFNFNFAYGGIATGAFQWAGKSASIDGTSNAGTPTAATTTEVINGSTDISNILVDGGAPGVAIKSITVNLTNNLRPIEAIGQAGPTDQAYGRSLVTGTIEAYFDSITLYNKLLNNTALTLEWDVSDGTTTYQFLMDNVKLNDGNPAVSGIDTDVMLTLNYTALYDATTGTNLQISKT